MKFSKNLLFVGATTILSSCGNIDGLNQPITASGPNPLDKPGMFRSLGTRSAQTDAGPSAINSSFKVGETVDVAIANTALFSRIPEPGDRHSKVLNVGESLNVIGLEDDFLKVSTSDGAVGYVSSVMVISKGSQPANIPVPSFEDIPPVPEIPSIEAPIDLPQEEIPTGPVTVPSLPDPDEVPSIPDSPVTPESTEPAIDEIPDPEIPGLPE